MMLINQSFTLLLCLTLKNKCENDINLVHHKKDDVFYDNKTAHDL
jgi:hypothetical protein